MCSLIVYICTIDISSYFEFWQSWRKISCISFQGRKWITDIVHTIQNRVYCNVDSFFPCFSSLSFGLSSCCLLVQSFSPFYLLGVQLCSISLGHHVLFIRSNLYWLYSGRQWGFCAGWFTPVIFNITMYKPLPQNSSSLFSFLFFSFWLNWSDFNNLKCKKMLQYI